MPLGNNETKEVPYEIPKDASDWVRSKTLLSSKHESVLI